MHIVWKMYIECIGALLLGQLAVRVVYAQSLGICVCLNLAQQLPPIIVFKLRELCNETETDFTISLINLYSMELFGIIFL